MTLTLHRISRLVYASLPTLAEHGAGAARYGGRWNSPDPGLRHDRRIVYASDTLALALLEVVVHTDGKVLRTNPYGRVTLSVHEDAVSELDALTLPVTWNAHPETPDTQVIGDEWYDLRASPVLRVPSAVLPTDAYGPGHANYLINAAHPDTPRAVRLHGPRPLTFDPRL